MCFSLSIFHGCIKRRLQEFGLYNPYISKLDLNDVDMLKQQPPQEKSFSKTNQKGGQALPLSGF